MHHTTRLLPAFTLFAALPLTAARADTVDLLYQFDNNSVSTFLNPGLSAGSLAPLLTGAGNPWTVSVGSLNPTGLLVNGTGGNLRAIAASATAGNWLTGNAYNFTFTIDPSVMLNLGSISFYEQGSGGVNGTGPSSWQLTVNNTLLGSGQTNPGSNSVRNSALNPAVDTWLLGTAGQGLTGQVTFSLSARGATNDTTASWRVDNFHLVATTAPVPLPAGAWLLGSGIAGLVAVRRRAA